MPRIDVFLQYYRPHVSGLTNMAAEIAEYVAMREYEVHVHAVGASRNDHELDGVIVHEYKKLFGFSRAVFSWQLIRAVVKLRSQATGIAHVHMPYPESFLLAWLLPRRWEIVATYQCDAPNGGIANNLIAAALDWSHRSLIRRSRFTVCSSADYADSSRLHGAIASNNRTVVPATSKDRAGGVPHYRIPGKRSVGFIGRPTHEKGVDVLLKAIDRLPEDVVLLFAGPTDGLTEKLGFDEELANKLAAQGKMRSLGFLEEGSIADFYASLDAYTHASVNSFDAFGIVQVEAASAGVPVVASDIPGVRTIVQTTGLGELVRPGDPDDLANGIKKALEGGYDTKAARAILEERYLAPVPHQQYLELFHQIQHPLHEH